MSLPGIGTGFAVGGLLLLSGAAALAQQADQPGHFDYYVLSLSWSPQFCATEAGVGSPLQCGEQRRYGFVLHGLWPQYARGGYPESCSAPAVVPDVVVDEMLPVMPSAALIQHEWDKHGTCSGLDMPGYFAAATSAYGSIRIPDAYRDPAGMVSTSVRQLEADFIAGNPGLESNALSVVCKKPYLTELRICLDKMLNPRPCGLGIRDRCGETVVLRPVRPGGG